MTVPTAARKEIAVGRVGSLGPFPVGFLATVRPITIAIYGPLTTVGAVSLGAMVVEGLLWSVTPRRRQRTSTHR